jgi:hypothetical protein
VLAVSVQNEGFLSEVTLGVVFMKQQPKLLEDAVVGKEVAQQ